MVFKLKKTGRILLVCLIIFSCKQPNKNHLLEDKVSKETFIIAYRNAFYHYYLSYATKGKIVKILDSLGDWSYQGDGGDLPPRYWGHPDSVAKQCIARADKIVFNPGEAPKTFLISELEKITRSKFLDSIAEVTYNDYDRWYEKEKLIGAKKIK